MSRTPAALMLLLAASVSDPAPAQAQASLLSHAVGSDIELVPVDPADPCVGELFRYTFAPWWTGQDLGAQTACPMVAAGDATLTGVDGMVAYGLGDAATLNVGGDLAFRTERHFDVVGAGPGLPFRNITFVTVPMRPSMDDLANSAAPELDKCVGDPAGPAVGDGIQNADDLICAWWTSRSTGQGSMMISRRDEATASWQDRVGFVDPFTGDIDFQGSWTAPLDAREDGYMVTVDGVVGTANAGLVLGGHDSAYPGRPIGPASDTTFLLPMPHHELDANLRAGSLLCGIQGVDWGDNNGDGNPDACNGPLWDGQHELTVITFDNDPLSPSANQFVAYSVSAPAGTLVFRGVNFRLSPGNAYLLTITSAQAPATWLLPHF